MWSRIEIRLSPVPRLVASERGARLVAALTGSSFPGENSSTDGAGIPQEALLIVGGLDHRVASVCPHQWLGFAGSSLALAPGCCAGHAFVCLDPTGPQASGCRDRLTDGSVTFLESTSEGLFPPSG